MAHYISRGLRLAAGLATLTTILLAHHSFGAEYDATKPVTITASSPKLSGRTRIATSFWTSKTPKAT